MAKLTLTDLTSSYRSNTALNANQALIEAAIENTLSRDGTAPNAMSASLDMGTNLIINVTDPSNPQDGATKNYVDGLISDGAANATASAASAAAALVSENNAAASEGNASTSATNASASEVAAAASYDSFDDRYLGAKSTAPTLDNDSNALLDGAMYFNDGTTPADGPALYVYDLTNTTWIRVSDGIISITANEFTGDGATVAFTISGTPPSDGALLVSVDGVSQPVSSYSVSGTTLTFSTAPPTDSLIESRGFEFASYSSLDLTSYVTKTGSDTLTNKTATSLILDGAPDFSGATNAGKRAIVSDLGILTLFASSYGVTATVASDQSAAIQAAIDAAEAAGGGNVVLPLGRVRIDTGLVIDSSNVVLVGAGSDGNHDVTHDDVGTILSAYGSGMTMLSVNSPSGASEYKRYGSGVRKVEFEGLGVAAKGIEIISVNGAILEDVRVTNCTTSQIATGTRTTLGEASDVQGCFWRNISLRMGDSAASQSADGLVLDGDAGAGNFSWNQIHNLTIRHYNGTGVHAINADNCRFTHVRIARPTGSGNGVIVNGRETGVKVIDNLRFLHIVSEAPILVQGTADGFAENAVGTYFLIDQSNGSATPTISTGVVCRWERGDGYLTNASFVAAAFGNSTAAAGAARSAMGSTCSAFFGNGSGNNIRLSGADGTSNVYGFNVASSGGALRLQRLAGSADFEVSFPTTVSSTLNVTGIAAVANGFSVGDSTLTSDQQMYIRGNSGHKSVLNFSDEAADFIGSIQYDHTTNTMTLRANGGARLDVNSSKVGPVTDNALTCGSSGVRWSTSYAYVFDATTSYKVAGVKVIGAQAAAIADASGGATVDTEARAALNDLLAKLRTHGVIAT